MDAALVGLMIVVAALRREESRGAHYRLDFPAERDTPTHPRTLDLTTGLRTPRANSPSSSLADVA